MEKTNPVSEKIIDEIPTMIYNTSLADDSSNDLFELNSNFSIRPIEDEVLPSQPDFDNSKLIKLDETLDPNTFIIPSTEPLDSHMLDLDFNLEPKKNEVESQSSKKEESNVPDFDNIASQDSKEKSDNLSPVNFDDPKSKTDDMSFSDFQFAPNISEEKFDLIDSSIISHSEASSFSENMDSSISSAVNKDNQLPLELSFDTTPVKEFQNDGVLSNSVNEEIPLDNSLANFELSSHLEESINKDNIDSIMSSTVASDSNILSFEDQSTTSVESSVNTTKIERPNFDTKQEEQSNISQKLDSSNYSSKSMELSLADSSNVSQIEVFDPNETICEDDSKYSEPVSNPSETTLGDVSTSFTSVNVEKISVPAVELAEEVIIPETFNEISSFQKLNTEKDSSLDFLKKDQQDVDLVPESDIVQVKSAIESVTSTTPLETKPIDDVLLQSISEQLISESLPTQSVLNTVENEIKPIESKVEPLIEQIEVSKECPAVEKEVVSSSTGTNAQSDAFDGGIDDDHDHELQESAASTPIPVVSAEPAPSTTEPENFAFERICEQTSSISVEPAVATEAPVCLARQAEELVEEMIAPAMAAASELQSQVSAVDNASAALVSPAVAVHNELHISECISSTGGGDENDISGISTAPPTATTDNTSSTSQSENVGFGSVDTGLTNSVHTSSSSAIAAASEVLSALKVKEVEEKEDEATTTAVASATGDKEAAAQQQPEEEEEEVVPSTEKEQEANTLEQTPLSSSSPQAAVVTEATAVTAEVPKTCPLLSSSSNPVSTPEPTIMARKNYRRDNSTDSEPESSGPDNLKECIQSILGPNAAEIIYWRDPKNTGPVFAVGLVILFSLSIFSVISVVAYTLFFTLLSTLSFRIYKNVLQAVQKTSEGHPFKEYLEVDITPSEERIQEIVSQLLAHFNCSVKRLRSVILVEDIVDSVKYLLIFWSLTYIGAWFNGMTLVILAYLGVFSLPKVYELNKAQVDQYIELIRSKINEISEKVPFLKKPVAVEKED